MLDWQELTRMTGGEPIAIEAVQVRRTGVRVEGRFELPPLARLTFEDQVFVAAFVRCHGSIKAIEASFGISYPTVKNRLNKIAEQLGFVTAEHLPDAPMTTSAEPGTPTDQASAVQALRLAVLEQLARGEITADAAVARLNQV